MLPSLLSKLTLWQRLGLVLVPILGAVTSVELYLTRQDAIDSANAAYDRSLLGALRSIDSNISTASGGLSVELPYSIFDLFELTASGQVYFRVATSDNLVELGSADMPPPPTALSKNPIFYDGFYFGEPVRVAALMRDLSAKPAGSSADTVTVQVAESKQSRQQFIDKFFQRTLVRDGFVFLSMMIATALAVAAALRPVTRLAKEVRERGADDIAPISTQELPSDLRPLVMAVNRQIEVTKAVVSSKHEFLDYASHQLRTHLTTLRIQMDYAKRINDVAQIHDALGALDAELTGVTRTTQQLLALGRSESAEVNLRTFDLGELVRRIAVSLLPQARQRSIDLGVNVEEEVFATGDELLLQEAVLNLASNALEYCPCGSVVTITGRHSDTGWILAVEDNGPGLPEDELALLGRRYTRGRQSPIGGSGSGLGLAIARIIAERHKGKLTLAHGSGAKGLLVSLEWEDTDSAPLAKK